MSNKGFVYRILPTEVQATKIKKTVGCSRLVYNLLLEDYKIQLDNKESGQKPKLKEVSCFKQQPEYEFLNEVDSLALANAKVHISDALSNFFDSKKGKRKGRKVGFPKKHKKSKNKLSYTTNNQHGTVDIQNGYIKLPKIGWVKLIYHRPIEGVIKSVTVTQERDDTFYVSVCCEINDGQRTNNKISDKNIDQLNVVGLDMSYEHFVVDSDDTVSDDMKPKYVRQYRTHEKKLGRLERQISRKEKGSKNREKARIAYAKASRHVANCRKDFAHKTALHYARNYDVVVIEDLDMQRMAQCKLRGHGKSANDLGFGMFKNYLSYKCDKYGSLLVVADKWYPSSKRCNHCGEVNHDLTLKDRTWVCPHCGTEISRDKNAAYNLRDWFYNSKNTAGTAGINACGDAASTSGSDPLASGACEAGSFLTL